MDNNFNKKVFGSFPDTVWEGRMPDLAGQKKGRRHSSLIVRYMAYAAACLCIPLAAATVILATRKSEAVPQADLSARSEIVYKVNNALQGNVVLPDSTRVTLNSGSTLRLADDFGTGTRTVILDGEGYFDVHKDRNVPFIINTPMGVQVCVTGTKFNVSCYSTDKQFDLTLIQGSVEVTTPQNEVLYVEPSQKVTIRNNFANLSDDADPQESLIWTEGVLKFDHTPMREVIAQVERWYGVDIEACDDSVYRGSFSAEFHSETLNEVLQLLCISSGLKYTVRDSTVTLAAK